MSQNGTVFIVSIIIGGLFVCSIPYVSAMEGPEIVELDALVNIYEPVVFDHTMHTEVASCAACHHHTTDLPAEDEKCLRCHKESGTADEIACSGCHTVYRDSAEIVAESKVTDLYHNDSTGLKRAYHLKCQGCHVEMDVASGCTDCHPKRNVTDKMAGAGG